MNIEIIETSTATTLNSITGIQKMMNLSKALITEETNQRLNEHGLTLSVKKTKSDINTEGILKKWVNTIHSLCQHVVVGTHGRLPGSTRRKVGMTSNHHAPYVLGFTHATMAGTMGCGYCEVS